MTTKERYESAKARYAKVGVDTDKAIQILKNVPISLHCWQGDDVKGFDQDGCINRWYPDNRQLSWKSNDTGRTDGRYGKGYVTGSWKEKNQYTCILCYF